MSMQVDKGLLVPNSSSKEKKAFLFGGQLKQER